MSEQDTAALLAELARIKVLFQLRAITAAMGLNAPAHLNQTAECVA